jgi:hypothetical protein
LNEKETPGFIIEDLDDFHLLIKPEAEFRVRKELEAEVRLALVRIAFTHIWITSLRRILTTPMITNEIESDSSWT